MQYAVKLSKLTFDILKTFSTINDGIMIRRGNVLSTMSVDGTCIGTATIEETFPVEFAIYGLSSFLSAVSLFDSPELIFEDGAGFVIIKSNGNQIRYWFSSNDFVLFPEETEIVLPTVDYQAEIDGDTFWGFLKGAGVLKHKRMSLVNREGKSLIVACTPDLEQSNDISFAIGDTDNPDGEYTIDISRLKLLSGGYDVKASASGLVQFSHDSVPFEFYTTLAAM